MRRDTKLAVAMGAALAFAPWVSPCQAQFSPFNQIPGPGGVPLNTIGGMPNVPGMMMEQNGNQQFDPQQQQGNRQNRGPGRGVPRFTDPMSLVIQEPVQEELKLTDKQKDKIKLLKDSADQAQRALMPARGFGGRGGNGGGPGGVANNGGPAGGGNGGGRVRGGNAGGAGAGVGGDGGPGNFGGQPGQGGVQGGGANLGGQNGQGGPGGFDWQAM